MLSEQQQRIRKAYSILIKVNKSDKAPIVVWKSLKYGQWHRQGSGMQGQMISLVVNVAYMHHWAKPSQTVFRRSAIWRWPLAYNGGPLLHKMWSVSSYSNAAGHQIEWNIYGDLKLHTSVNGDKSMAPTSKFTLAPTSFSLSLTPA